MTIKDSLLLFREHPAAEKVIALMTKERVKIKLEGGVGSIFPVLGAIVGMALEEGQLFVLDEREEAAYFYNDLMTFLGDEVRFLPSSFRRDGNFESKDNDSILVRTEVLNALATGDAKWVVTYTGALAEKVLSKKSLVERSMLVNKGDILSLSHLESELDRYGFERTDFVYEPGQYSIRGSIVDIYSYSADRPVRVDFFGNEVDSIRFFNIETQLSEQSLEKITIIPDLSIEKDSTDSCNLIDFVDPNSVWWFKDPLLQHDIISRFKESDSSDLLSTAEDIFGALDRSRVVEWGMELLYKQEVVTLHTELQLVVNKQFDILADSLKERMDSGFHIYICSNNERQLQRLRDIFSDKGHEINFVSVEGTIHTGFCDYDLKICLYTEHQIFDRYHKYQLKAARFRKERESITISDLQNLHPGDYVVHIDHGIGQFGGLTRLNNNGKIQEAIRLIYKNQAQLYVSLNALNKISKYRGKDSTPPSINKLGGEAWSRLKERTKSKVKDIARELVELYARRREEKAYAFAPDSYLQEEMEALFTYEETPDQAKAVEAVKRDMESPHVMDRLICGDVGFGKTEVAIRAAFKAVADSKQVALLVPTTILAYQHYNTFSERLKGMPCRVEYISRMKSRADIKKIIEELSDGKIDIIIGTHRLVSNDIQFKDLGLLIVDEEQKFGVSVKEKLKRLKLNVDTITMTATPIPRTLHFSLMGARDISVIRTPPTNRYPIITELHRFDEEIIGDAIKYELGRGGQVFFIHNRIQNIREIQFMIHRIVPEIKSVVAHGEMRGAELEQVMHDFIRGDYDLLIATTIIESGLDIPNANTIIINQAQNYGLSDLHQLRGRVGRSNRKAFCYLLAPPLEMVNEDARRRLKAIEDYSGLGSGFSIAMQDLDIRGAGNILGGEQSGFITEIGYETYQRILNEALLELREESPRLHKETAKEHKIEPEEFTVECVVDTDFELFLPDSYVENVSERIRLYRELDSIVDDEQLQRFEIELEDRFGKLPPQARGLADIVRVRRLSQEMGVERLVAKSGKAILYFISNSNSPFYSSPVFQNMLIFVQRQIVPGRMNERNNKLTLTFDNVENILQLSEIIKRMNSFIFGLTKEK